LPTRLLACLLLVAALGCKQDWSIPSQNLGADGGPRGQDNQGIDTGERPDAGPGRTQEDMQSEPGRAGNAGRNAEPQAGTSGSPGQGQGQAGGADAPSGGPAAGSGGSGGQPTDPPPQEETCTTPGSLRCTGAGGEREICQDGLFRGTEACQPSEVCDAQGECIEVAAICQGNAGSTVCDGQGGLVSCADNGSVRAQESCQSERHCQVGRSTGRCPQCIPEEFRCEGASLEQCGADGQAYTRIMTCDNASLCKAESGACTDAACAADRFTCAGDELQRCNAAQTGFERVMACGAGLCDARRGTCLACSAGSRSCDSNTALICDATGENLTRTACSAPRSTCVGAGQCVECAADVPCPQTTQACRATSCNLRSGSCEDTRVAAGAGCARRDGGSGVCDAAGGCVECLTEGDGRCAGATPHCSSAHSCVRCLQDDQCGFGEKCINNSCIAKCGDGVLDEGEDCERGYLNSSASNCDFLTCKRLNYVNCRDSSAICMGGTACLAAFYCLPTSDMNCVTSCPEVPGMRTGCSRGICYLDCTAAAGGRCPSDMHCENASVDGTFITDMCFGN
jgi:hypothetical protein